MKIINGFHLKNVRGDILGGITAAVVALPLALAFGNAALGPGGAIYGLYGAVVVGFLAALFGGTPAQVSGPTGPMSVTVAGVVAGLAVEPLDCQFTYTRQYPESKKPQKFLAKNLAGNLVKKKSLKVWK